MEYFYTNANISDTLLLTSKGAVDWQANGFLPSEISALQIQGTLNGEFVTCYPIHDKTVLLSAVGNLITASPIDGKFYQIITEAEALAVKQQIQEQIVYPVSEWEVYTGRKEVGENGSI